MALEAQNNPYPSLLMVEGDPEALPDADPASGQRRLAVGTDHLLYLVDDSGVKHAVGGMANPMTTSQDLIIGGSSGTPGRLAKGSNGTFLGVVSGSLAWATPAGGGGSITYVDSGNTGGGSPVALPNGYGTGIDLASISLTAGTWLVIGRAMSSTTATGVALQVGIFDGTVTLAGCGHAFIGVDNKDDDHSLFGFTTLASTTTVKLQASANATGVSMYFRHLAALKVA
jgi:hypothetical protein